MYLTLEQTFIKGNLFVVFAPGVGILYFAVVLVSVLYSIHGEKLLEKVKTSNYMYGCGHQVNKQYYLFFLS